MEETMLSGFCINKASTKTKEGSRSSSSSSSSSGTKCGRWNPTSEQVKVLTDLFRSGLRTPSTDQIQKISSQLSFYGKIESKNVFYWFQNHKARERQKRRKVISVDNDNDNDNDNDDDDFFFLKQDHHKKMSTTTVIPSPKRSYVEIYNNNNKVISEPERVIETLQLFPLSSFGDDSDSEKLRFHANHDYCCREKISYSTFETSQMDHPPLDLRLSFL